jgi:glycosyltransferase involved in cell wall biosynthesis
MKLSIIIPIYGVENYLSKCVDSVLNQDYGDYEIILVDDGSPDACPAICDEYAAIHENIRVVHRETGD